MPLKTIENLNIFQFWKKLDDRWKSPFFTWSASPEGWMKLLAFDPAAVFLMRPEDVAEESLNGLFSFCRRHREKLIAGYLSYDLGYGLLDIVPAIKSEADLPLALFMAYDNFMILNDKDVVLNYNDSGYPDLIAEINSSPRVASSIESRPESAFRMKLNPEEYRKNFMRIQEYIRAGDIYQINYTHTLEAEASIPDRELWPRILERNPVGHAAYLEGEGVTILSASPESFIKVRRKSIVSKPIKGTRHRGRTPAEDRKQTEDLLKSEKEQAELFMIIDLLRNDLGKVCRIGSVRVRERKKLQYLPHLIHSHAEIEGILKEGVDGVRALISMFPGGSITGCPKKRAMEIIDELEGARRGPYTGSVGYILPDGDMEFNIAIRTVVRKDNRLHLGVGGGITIDSRMEDEYNETMIKARSFL